MIDGEIYITKIKKYYIEPTYLILELWGPFRMTKMILEW